MCASAQSTAAPTICMPHTIKKMGVEATFVDPDCTEEELDAGVPGTTQRRYSARPSPIRRWWFWILRSLPKLAHAHGVPLIVDNTFATPINCRPFEWGADIVTHSTTKYMDGHAPGVGGAIVDSGNFDWEAHADKFPGLTTPDETYHGIVYTQKFGKRRLYHQGHGAADAGSGIHPVSSERVSSEYRAWRRCICGWRRHCENATEGGRVPERP